MIAKVDSFNENPYRALPFLQTNPYRFKKKEKIVEEEKNNTWTSGGIRRYYTLYHYVKDYTLEQRVAHLKKFINSLRSSYLNLFKYKTWQHLSRACFGNSMRRIMVLKPRLKIETLLGSASTPARDESKITPMQENLKRKGIQLNCLNPPHLTQVNHTRPEIIEAYFKEVAEQKWRGKNHDEWIALHRRLFQAIDCITFQELNQKLWICCQTLNKLLGNNSYAIGFVPGKSQQWIAELALPYLDQAPASSFEHATDSALVKRGYQSCLKTPERHFVIFDDASYSGAQLAEVIHGLRRAVGAVHQQKKCHLYLVVPFMSKPALEFLQRDGKQDVAIFDALKDLGNLKVQIITTGRRITAITDVFSEQERNRLIELEGSDGLSIYCNGRSWNKCLTYMEWKVPDHASIPYSVKIWHKYDEEKKSQVVRDRFITDFPPPYKV